MSERAPRWLDPVGLCIGLGLLAFGGWLQAHHELLPSPRTLRPLRLYGSALAWLISWLLGLGALLLAFPRLRSWSRRWLPITPLPALVVLLCWPYPYEWSVSEDCEVCYSGRWRAGHGVIFGATRWRLELGDEVDPARDATLRICWPPEAIETHVHRWRFGGGKESSLADHILASGHHHWSDFVTYMQDRPAFQRYVQAEIDSGRVSRAELRALLAAIDGQMLGETEATRAAAELEQRLVDGWRESWPQSR